jgi:hypothetical protein
VRPQPEQPLQVWQQLTGDMLKISLLMQLSVSWCLSDARQRYDTPRSVEGRRTESGVIDWNGSPPRLVATSAGYVDLRTPQLRKGSFLQAILEHGRSRRENLYAS